MQLYSSVRYPPYTDTKMNILMTLMKKRSKLPTKYLSHLLIFGLGVGTALLVNHYVKVILQFLGHWNVGVGGKG